MTEIAYPWPVGEVWPHTEIVHGRFAGDCRCQDCQAVPNG